MGLFRSPRPADLFEYHDVSGNLALVGWLLPRVNYPHLNLPPAPVSAALGADVSAVL